MLDNNNKDKSNNKNNKENKTIQSMTKDHLDQILNADQKKRATTNYHTSFKAIGSQLMQQNIIGGQRYQPYSKSTTTTSNDQSESRSSSTKSSKGVQQPQPVQQSNNNQRPGSNNSNKRQQQLQPKKSKWGDQLSS
ncbi:hypothetical protein SAMD00019534_031620, partial [Acytostelium subglobosum LB1]|uniref:hypothetical protein n=1 Tax=Acytostelium subglobosum LB1 TaxID=1410327 RepID=UPI000644B800